MQKIMKEVAKNEGKQVKIEKFILSRIKITRLLAFKEHECLSSQGTVQIQS